MEEVAFVKEKMSILKHIISINDIEELKQIKKYIESIHNELASGNNTHAKEFENWNEQFTDTKNMLEPIEGYGLTLGDFRKMIFDSEKGEQFPIEEFQKKLKKLYNEA